MILSIKLTEDESLILKRILSQNQIKHGNSLQAELLLSILKKLRHARGDPKEEKLSSHSDLLRKEVELVKGKLQDYQK